MVRRIVFVVASFLTVAMLIAEPVAADPLTDEATFVAEINALRAARGVKPVEMNGALTDVARQWAYKMALDGGISHRSDLSVGAPSSWTFLGENVGLGVDVHSLHEAFIASPTHYANLVDPRFDSVGIGVVMVGSTMFVAQEFMQGGYQPVVTKTVVKAKKKPCRTRRCRRARARIRGRA